MRDPYASVGRFRSAAGGQNSQDRAANMGKYFQKLTTKPVPPTEEQVCEELLVIGSPTTHHASLLCASVSQIVL